MCKVWSDAIPFRLFIHFNLPTIITTPQILIQNKYEKIIKEKDDNFARIARNARKARYAGKAGKASIAKRNVLNLIRKKGN